MFTLMGLSLMDLIELRMDDNVFPALPVPLPLFDVPSDKHDEPLSLFAFSDTPPLQPFDPSLSSLPSWQYFRCCGSTLLEGCGETSFGGLTLVDGSDWWLITVTSGVLVFLFSPKMSFCYLRRSASNRFWYFFDVLSVKLPLWIIIDESARLVRDRLLITVPRVQCLIM